MNVQERGKIRTEDKEEEQLLFMSLLNGSYGFPVSEVPGVKLIRVWQNQGANPP